MPVGSVFPSHRVQVTVLAALMFALLTAALGAAYALSAARAPQPAAGDMAEVPAGELRFHLPASFRPAEAERIPPELEAHAYVDRQRPSRRLIAVRVGSQPAARGVAVLDRVLPALIDAGGQDRVAVKALMRYPHPRFLVDEWIGVSVEGNRVMRWHLAADLTLNGRVHWLLYLTDRVESGEDAQHVLLYNLALLRSIHQSAAVPAPNRG